MSLVSCSDTPPLTGDETASECLFCFTDETKTAGLGAYRHQSGAFGDNRMPEAVGPGAAFIDYDTDGWPDILLAGGGTWPDHRIDSVASIWLYHNERDGTFSLKTNEAGLAGIDTYSFGFGVADYDNDGDEDFFMATLYENLLFRNDGGHFVEVGEQAGIADAALWTQSSIFFDADRDGWLDLFTVNYVDWSLKEHIAKKAQGTFGYSPREWPGVSGMYYHNNRDGTFTNRTRQDGFWGAIPVQDNKTLGVTELDVTNDGWPDLYVTNDTERNLLFVNDGDGTFTEKAVESGVAYDADGRTRAGMGVDAGVIDTTGEVSIVTGNFSNEMVGVYTYAGNGSFTERSTASKIGHATLKTLTFGLFLADLDLDTDLDLFLCNGHVMKDVSEPGITYRQASQLFLNTGQGIFKEHVADTLLTRTKMVGRSALYGDYDRDGDLDILIAENEGPVHLWRNNIQKGNYLRLRLQGNKSNRDGLGTRVVIKTNGKKLERRLRPGTGYLSSMEKVITFGLDQQTRVDSMWVYWPGRDLDVIASVPTNREYLLREGTGQLVPFGSGALARRN